MSSLPTAQKKTTPQSTCSWNYLIQYYCFLLLSEEEQQQNGILNPIQGRGGVENVMLRLFKGLEGGSSQG